MIRTHIQSYNEYRETSEMGFEPGNLRLQDLNGTTAPRRLFDCQGYKTSLYFLYTLFPFSLSSLLAKLSVKFTDSTTFGRDISLVNAYWLRFSLDIRGLLVHYSRTHELFRYPQLKDTGPFLRQINVEVANICSGIYGSILLY